MVALIGWFHRDVPRPVLIQQVPREFPAHPRQDRSVGSMATHHPAQSRHRTEQQRRACYSLPPSSPRNAWKSFASPKLR